jgi:hypothetical protein
MLKPSPIRIVIGLCAGVVLILIAAWSSGFTGEICYETKTGQQHCDPYNLAPFLVIKAFEGLHTLDTVITALATVAIAWFTWTLWRATTGTLKATQDSIQLARDEFNASHRPKLRLKHIWLASPDGQNASADLWSRSPLVVRLDIVNVGDTVAYVDFINFATVIVRERERLPGRPPFNEPGTPQNFLNDSPVEIGMTLTVPLGDGRILAPDEVRDIAWRRARLYYVGTIGYRDAPRGQDAARKLKQTAFCRYLDFTNVDADNPPIGSRVRFAIDPDHDYEYKD